MNDPTKKERSFWFHNEGKKWNRFKKRKKKKEKKETKELCDWVVSFKMRGKKRGENGTDLRKEKKTKEERGAM